MWCMSTSIINHVFYHLPVSINVHHLFRYDAIDEQEFHTILADIVFFLDT